MRHFLAPALSILMLAPGVMPPTAEGFLKALARSPLALAPSLAAARLRAIALPMITALTGAQLLMAAGAIEHPVYGLDDGSTSGSQKTGQCPPTASLSVRDKTLSYDGCGAPPTKARGGYLGPSPFSEPGLPIAPHTRAKPTTPATRNRRREKYFEEMEPDLRRRWILIWLNTW